MITTAVTATQGGNTSGGLLLRVLVLTGAANASAQTGATAINPTASSINCSITTTTAGSLVVGAAESDTGAGTYTAESGTTIIDQIIDTTHHNEIYASLQATSLTVTPGTITFGVTNALPPESDIAAAEILPNGTISTDASSPAAATTATATTITTASFSPPAGSLLVALIGSNGNGTNPSGTTMTVTDSAGLVWTQLVACTTYSYTGVWVAQVPSPLLTNNFSGGTSGTTVTTSNSGSISGNAFDVVNVGTGTTVAYDNTQTLHGILSCKIASGATGASAFVQYSTSFGSQATAYWRAYFYFTAIPGAGIRLFNATTSTVQSVYSVSLNTSGKLAISYSSAGTNFATFTAAVPLNQWFRVEGFETASATVGQVSASLFSVPDSTVATETHTSTATLNTASTTAFSYNFGDSNSTANNGPYWIAGVGLSNVGLLGPATTPTFGYVWG